MRTGSPQLGMKYIFVILFWMFPVHLHAQDIQISVGYLQGFAYNNTVELYKGGTGITAEYQLYGDSFTYSGGLEFRTVQWGNQASIKLALKKSIAPRAEISVSLYNGLALFYNHPLYTGSAEVRSNFILLNKEGFKAGIFAGVRYTFCPAYSNYSPINKLAEIPVGLFFGF